jgi:hypothetical protein
MPADEDVKAFVEEMIIERMHKDAAPEEAIEKVSERKISDRQKALEDKASRIVMTLRRRGVSAPMYSHYLKNVPLYVSSETEPAKAVEEAYELANMPDDPFDRDSVEQMVLARMFEEAEPVEEAEPAEEPAEMISEDQIAEEAAIQAQKIVDAMKKAEILPDRAHWDQLSDAIFGVSDDTEARVLPENFNAVYGILAENLDMMELDAVSKEALVKAVRELIASEEALGRALDEFSAELAEKCMTRFRNENVTYLKFTTYMNGLEGNAVIEVRWVDEVDSLIKEVVAGTSRPEDLKDISAEELLEKVRGHLSEIEETEFAEEAPVEEVPAAEEIAEGVEPYPAAEIFDIPGDIADNVEELTEAFRTAIISFPGDDLNREWRKFYRSYKQKGSYPVDSYISGIIMNTVGMVKIGKTSEEKDRIDRSEKYAVEEVNRIMEEQERRRQKGEALSRKKNLKGLFPALVTIFSIGAALQGIVPLVAALALSGTTFSGYMIYKYVFLAVAFGYDRGKQRLSIEELQYRVEREADMLFGRDRPFKVEVIPHKKWIDEYGRYANVSTDTIYVNEHMARSPLNIFVPLLNHEKAEFDLNRERGRKALIRNMLFPAELAANMREFISLITIPFSARVRMLKKENSLRESILSMEISEGQKAWIRGIAGDKWFENLRTMAEARAKSERKNAYREYSSYLDNLLIMFWSGVSVEQISRADSAYSGRLLREDSRDLSAKIALLTKYMKRVTPALLSRDYRVLAGRIEFYKGLDMQINESLLRLNPRIFMSLSRLASNSGEARELGITPVELMKRKVNLLRGADTELSLVLLRMRLSELEKKANFAISCGLPLDLSVFGLSEEEMIDKAIKAHLKAMGTAVPMPDTGKLLDLVVKARTDAPSKEELASIARTVYEVLSAGDADMRRRSEIFLRSCEEFVPSLAKDIPVGSLSVKDPKKFAFMLGKMIYADNVAGESGQAVSTDSFKEYFERYNTEVVKGLTQFKDLAPEEQEEAVREVSDFMTSRILEVSGDHFDFDRLSWDEKIQLRNMLNMFYEQSPEPFSKRFAAERLVGISRNIDKGRVEKALARHPARRDITPLYRQVEKEFASYEKDVKKGLAGVKKYAASPDRVDLSNVRLSGKLSSVKDGKDLFLGEFENLLSLEKRTVSASRRIALEQRAVEKAVSSADEYNPVYRHEARVFEHNHDKYVLNLLMEMMLDKELAEANERSSGAVRAILSAVGRISMRRDLSWEISGPSGARRTELLKSDDRGVREIERFLVSTRRKAAAADSGAEFREKIYPDFLRGLQDIASNLRRTPTGAWEMTDAAGEVLSKDLLAGTDDREIEDILNSLISLKDAETGMDVFQQRLSSLREELSEALDKEDGRAFSESFGEEGLKDFKELSLALSEYFSVARPRSFVLEQVYRKPGSVLKSSLMKYLGRAEDVVSGFIRSSLRQKAVTVTGALFILLMLPASVFAVAGVQDISFDDMGMAPGIAPDTGIVPLDQSVVPSIGASRDLSPDVDMYSPSLTVSSADGVSLVLEGVPQGIDIEQAESSIRDLRDIGAVVEYIDNNPVYEGTLNKVMPLIKAVADGALVSASPRWHDSEEAAALQRGLVKADPVRYDVGVYGYDGVIGSDTLNALELFQRDHGLEPDRVAGPLTVTALVKEILLHSLSDTERVLEERSDSRYSAEALSYAKNGNRERAIETAAQIEDETLRLNTLRGIREFITLAEDSRIASDAVVGRDIIEAGAAVRSDTSGALMPVPENWALIDAEGHMVSPDPVSLIDHAVIGGETWQVSDKGFLLERYPDSFLRKIPLINLIRRLIVSERENVYFKDLKGFPEGTRFLMRDGREITGAVSRPEDMRWVNKVYLPGEEQPYTIVPCDTVLYKGTEGRIKEVKYFQEGLPDEISAVLGTEDVIYYSAGDERVSSMRVNPDPKAKPSFAVDTKGRRHKCMPADGFSLTETGEIHVYGGLEDVPVDGMVSFKSLYEHMDDNAGRIDRLNTSARRAQYDLGRRLYTGEELKLFASYSWNSLLDVDFTDLGEWGAMAGVTIPLVTLDAKNSSEYNMYNWLGYVQQHMRGAELYKVRMFSLIMAQNDYISIMDKSVTLREEMDQAGMRVDQITQKYNEQQKRGFVPPSTKTELNRARSYLIEKEQEYADLMDHRQVVLAFISDIIGFEGLADFNIYPDAVDVDAVNSMLSNNGVDPVEFWGDYMGIITELDVSLSDAEKVKKIAESKRAWKFDLGIGFSLEESLFSAAVLFPIISTDKGPEFIEQLHQLRTDMKEAELQSLAEERRYNLAQLKLLRDYTEDLMSVRGLSSVIEPLALEVERKQQQYAKGKITFGQLVNARTGLMSYRLYLIEIQKLNSAVNMEIRKIQREVMDSEQYLPKAQDYREVELDRLSPEQNWTYARQRALTPGGHLYEPTSELRYLEEARSHIDHMAERKTFLGLTTWGNAWKANRDMIDRLLGDMILTAGKIRDVEQINLKKDLAERSIAYLLAKERYGKASGRLSRFEDPSFTRKFRDETAVLEAEKAKAELELLEALKEIRMARSELLQMLGDDPARKAPLGELPEVSVGDIDRILSSEVYSEMDISASLEALQAQRRVYETMYRLSEEMNLTDLGEVFSALGIADENGYYIRQFAWGEEMSLPLVSDYSKSSDFREHLERQIQFVDSKIQETRAELRSKKAHALEALGSLRKSISVYEEQLEESGRRIEALKFDRTADAEAVRGEFAVYDQLESMLLRAKQRYADINTAVKMYEAYYPEPEAEIAEPPYADEEVRTEIELKIEELNDLLYEAVREKKEFVTFEIASPITIQEAPVTEAWVRKQNPKTGKYRMTRIEKKDEDADEIEIGLTMMLKFNVYNNLRDMRLGQISDSLSGQARILEEEKFVEAYRSAASAAVEFLSEREILGMMEERLADLESLLVREEEKEKATGESALESVEENISALKAGIREQRGEISRKREVLAELMGTDWAVGIEPVTGEREQLYSVSDVIAGMKEAGADQEDIDLMLESILQKDPMMRFYAEEVAKTRVEMKMAEDGLYPGWGGSFFRGATIDVSLGAAWP